MINIGFDVSINSTAICLETSNTYHFFSCYVGFKESYMNSKTRCFNELKDVETFEIIKLERQWKQLSKKDKNNYSLSEFIKLTDANKNVNIIENKINPYLISANSISMEGFSYGSKGSSLIDIVGFTYILRNMISRYKNLTIVSPSQVKKYAGRNSDQKTGNANKEQMFDLFLQQSDSKLQSSKLWKTVKGNIDGFKRNLKSGIKIKTPLDDLIDSYFVLKSSGNNN